MKTFKNPFEASRWVIATYNDAFVQDKVFTRIINMKKVTGQYIFKPEFIN